MSAKVIFELCAETLQACIAARDGGADRIELCSALSEDGLTPSHGLIGAAVQQSGLPVHVLIRPRGGDFVYSDEVLGLMCEDIHHARELGARGVVIGVLKGDNTIDVERTKELMMHAGTLEVSFHRAFDLVSDQAAALEELIQLGCHRLLTSGGKPDAVMGAENLARLVRLADDRIQIAAGGGVRLENAAKLVRESGVPQLHGSLRRKVAVSPENVLGGQAAAYIVDPADVRAMIDTLKQF